jgi:hypothetical protein
MLVYQHKPIGHEFESHPFKQGVAQLEEQSANGINSVGRVKEFPLSQVRLLYSVPRPSKPLCQGHSNRIFRPSDSDF